MKVLLSTAYWPNLHYFSYLINADEIVIEQYDYYQKQSFRNRTRILSANGPLDLFVPVHKKNTKECVKDLALSYTERWQARHWGAIKSAYGNSPYFEFFAQDIENMYQEDYKTLLEFNLAQINCVFKILKIKKEVCLSYSFQKDCENSIDVRELIHPKKQFTGDVQIPIDLSKEYYQTFSAKFSFVQNLSILDLIFNVGLGAGEYLKIPSRN